MKHVKKTSEKSFTELVWAAACKIPKGKVSTYSQIAAAIGKPGASRAVGNALSKSPGMPRVPCHRVVRSDGSVGGFASGPKKKMQLLESEGVRIALGKVDLDKLLHKS